MATPSPSWVILGTVPRVSTADELQAGADLSLALAALPRVTQLTVAPTGFPAGPDPHAGLDFPCVLAADLSGLLLTVTPPSASDRPPSQPRVYRGPDGVERTIHVGLVPQPAYFVLDVPSATASRVPDPDPDVLDSASVGVIAAPGRRGYMVVELDLELRRRHLPRRQARVNRAKGLLACDPFADQPDMAYVPLPKGGGHHCNYCFQKKLGSRRCVQVSSGHMDGLTLEN